jgi:hypothetical protein
MRAADLIAALPERREEFEATGDWAEELRTLPPNTVETLWGLGMFGLKSPAELGGSPLDPLSFCDVIEELACINTSVAWAAVIGAGCDGVAGGWLPRGGRPQGVRGRPSVPCGRGATVAARHRHSCGLRVPSNRPLGLLKRDPACGLADRHVRHRRFLLSSWPGSQS